MEADQIFFGRNVLIEAARRGVSILEGFYENTRGRELLAHYTTAKLTKGIPAAVRKESHQGVAFRLRHSFYDRRPLEQALSRRNKVLVCNHVQDVQNLGAIMRSAAAFGFDLIVHESRRSASLTPAALKASMGMAFHIGLREVTNCAQFCRDLVKNQFWLVGLEAGGARSLYDWRPSLPMALVVGSEEKGLDRPVKAQLHESLSIPVKDEVDSLNVAQASAVALSWIFSREGIR